MDFSYADRTEDDPESKLVNFYISRYKVGIGLVQHGVVRAAPRMTATCEADVCPARAPKPVWNHTRMGVVAHEPHAWL